MENTMTWIDLKTKNPNKWAFLKDVKRDTSGDITSFSLLALCSIDEKPKYEGRYLKDNIRFTCINTNDDSAGVLAYLW